jgi:hypothetical protein
VKYLDFAKIASCHNVLKSDVLITKHIPNPTTKQKVDLICILIFLVQYFFLLCKTWAEAGHNTDNKDWIIFHEKSEKLGGTLVHCKSHLVPKLAWEFFE